LPWKFSELWQFNNQPNQLAKSGWFSWWLNGKEKRKKKK